MTSPLSGAAETKLIMNHTMKNTSHGSGGNSIMKGGNMRNDFEMEICYHNIFTINLVEREHSDIALVGRKSIMRWLQCGSAST